MKAIGLSLISLFLFNLLGCSGLVETEVPLFDLELSEDRSYYIVKNLNKLDEKEIIVPEKWNGIPIMEIADFAFLECNNLHSVILEGEIKKIGDYAFSKCDMLKTFVASGYEEFVGYGAFQECPKLTNITLPFVGKSLDAVGEESLFGYIFGKKEISYLSCVTQWYSENESVDFYLPKTLKNIKILKGDKISYGAFSGCADIESVSVPATISRIEEKAFYGSGLTTFVAEKGSELSYVAKNSFCSKTSHFYFGGSLEQWCSIVFEDKSSTPLYLDPHFYMLNENDEWVEVIDLVIPDTVTIIGAYQFNRFSGLKSAHIPNSVKSLEDYSFAHCMGLEKVFISANVETFGKAVFYGCQSLKSVEFEEGSKLTDLGGSLTFDLCLKLESIQLPSGVSVIPNAGFSACFALKNINIPDGTTRIGNRAFEDCTSLTSIFIPKTVTEIGINAFKNCENLTIYCESSGPMEGWDETWNSSNCKVVWNSKV